MAKEENSGDAAQQNDAGNKDDIYENPAPKKFVRVVTVMAYLFSVSFMGLALSAYYIFLWEPPNPRTIRRNFYISTEPQVEFLIDDPSLNQDYELSEFQRNLTSRSLLRELAMLSNNSGKPIEGRIIVKKKHRILEDDIDDRGRLNESPSDLQDSFAEILRRNETKILQEEMLKNTMLETNNIEELNSTNLLTSRKMQINLPGELEPNNPQDQTNISDSSALRTVDSKPLTISGGETRKDRLQHDVKEMKFKSMFSLNKTKISNFRKRRDRNFSQLIESNNNITKDFSKDDVLQKDPLPVVFPPELKIDDNINIATISEDTQIEKITKSPVAGERPEKLEINETQRYSGLLTMLTESILSNRISSDTPLSSTFEASPTESPLSTMNKYTETIDTIENNNASTTD